jgi:hypothetical protein
VTLFPTVTDCEAGAADSEKSGAALTTRVTDAEWLRLPLLAVIVRVKVPAGVDLLVLTVSVDEPEPPLIEAGLKLPVAPEGSPETLNTTVPLKPLIGLTLAV